MTRSRLGQNVNRFLEVGNVTLLTGLLKHSPSFIFRLVRNMIIVDDLGVLALVRVMS